MSTNVIKSQGVTIAKGDAASPEVFTSIADVMSIGGPTSVNNEIDVTSLSDTAKAFISALVDNGEVSIGMGFVPTNATQQAIFTDLAAGSTNEANYRITFTDSPASTFTFSAWVRDAAVGVSVDDKVSLDATLRVTSALTIAWGS